MNALDQKLKTAKRSFRAKILLGALAGVWLFAVVLPLVYWVHAVSFQIAPQSAANHSSVSVSDGVGVVLFDAAYIFGKRATLRFSSHGFISRTLQVDLEKSASPLLIEMREAPVRVVVTTEPPLPQTRWHVDGVYADTAAQFEREFLPGAVSIAADNEFYRPQTVQLEVQRGEDLTHHLDLTPVAGIIDLRSEPAGAQVTINDEEKGLTPIRITTLAGGLYRVRVALEGYQNVEEEIVVTNTRNEVVRDYRLTLNQTSARIRASPAGGILRVNGVATEVAPSLSLAAGRRHIIRYEKPGYFPQSREVVLKAHQSVEIALELEKEIGEVVIRSTPPADLFINGKAAGVTPQTHYLQALRQKITLQRTGYRSVELSLTPSAAAPLLVDEKLATEFVARLSEAKPVVNAAAGVTLKFFDPGAQFPNRFTMGASNKDKARRANEFQREINLTKSFYVSITEITEEQFAMYKPLQPTGKNLPIRNVSWREAAEFCNWMSVRDGLQSVYDFADGKLRDFDATADGYRLLSEAEWEWLARVAGRGKIARFVWGDDTTIPAKSGNFADQSAKGRVSKFIPRYNDGFVDVAPVASFVVDAAGLYDMAGNVSEWVHDIYDLRPPKPGLVEVNPFGVEADDGVGYERTIKGANFRSASITDLRSSFRDGLSGGRDDLGFRVARYLYGKE